MKNQQAVFQNVLMIVIITSVYNNVSFIWSQIANDGDSDRKDIQEYTTIAPVSRKRKCKQHHIFLKYIVLTV